MNKQKRGWINNETPMHVIIEKKGSAAKTAIIGMLYDSKDKYDANKQLSLSDAAEAVGKPHILPSLVAVLNKIRDISE